MPGVPARGGCRGAPAAIPGARPLELPHSHQVCPSHPSPFPSSLGPASISGLKAKEFPSQKFHPEQCPRRCLKMQGGRQMKFCLDEVWSFSGSQLELQNGWEAPTGGSHCRRPGGRAVHPFPQGKELPEALPRLWKELSSAGRDVLPGPRGCPSTAGSARHRPLLLPNLRWSQRRAGSPLDPRELCPVPPGQGWGWG